MAILQIPIVKAKGQFVPINTDSPEDGGDLSPEVFTEALGLGLKVLINRGTSKITKAAYPKAEELAAAAISKAGEQLELIRTNKIKFTGQKKAAGISGEVKTRAMQLAKAIVKDEMKRVGKKIAHTKASEITATAKEVLEIMPELYEQAKAEVEARKAIKISDKINISGIKADAGLVAKAEARKAKAGTLSKTQAGKVKTRSKGQSATA